MSALDDLADWMQRLRELRAQDARLRERAVRQLAVMGIPASLRSDGTITVSASGFEYLRSLATYSQPASAVSQIMGIPLYRAPDWTFEPSAVAEARLAAIILRLFKRIVRWLARRSRQGAGFGVDA